MGRRVKNSGVQIQPYINSLSSPNLKAAKVGKMPHSSAIHKKQLQLGTCRRYNAGKRQTSSFLPMPLVGSTVSMMGIATIGHQSQKTTGLSVTL